MQIFSQNKLFRWVSLGCFLTVAAFLIYLVFFDATPSFAKLRITTSYSVGIALSPAGDKLAIAGDGLEIVDIASLKTIKSLPLVEKIDYPNPVLWSSDGRHLVTAGSTAIYVLEANSGKVLQKIPRKSTIVDSLTINPTGNILTIVERDTPLLLWDLLAGQPFKTNIEGHFLATFSPDNKIVATLNAKGQAIQLFDLQTGSLLKEFELNIGGRVSVINFTPDGKYLIAGSDGGYAGSIKLWRIADGNLIYTKEDLPNPVATLAISNNGQTMAIGRHVPGTLEVDRLASLQPEVELRRVSDGKLIGKLSGHNGGVFYLFFSKGDKMLISGSSDDTVQFWRLAS